MVSLLVAINNNGDVMLGPLHTRQPAQLHIDVVLHILGSLSDSYRAAVAKLVCKEAYKEFKQHRIIRATACCELPTACLSGLLQYHNLESEQQKQLMDIVARQGDLPRLQLLHELGLVWDRRSLCMAAAKSGHLAVLQWLAKQTCGNLSDNNLYRTASSAAAAGGHVNILQWLSTQAPASTWYSGLCQDAASYGYVEVLMWLRAQDPPCPWDEDVCLLAAAEGHLEVLQWLRAQDPPCPWDDNTCDWAAEHGHLAILQWAKAQNPPCPSDHFVHKKAAGNGHLEIVKWALAQDLPVRRERPVVEQQMCNEAAMFGHLHILQWVLAQQQSTPQSAPYCCWRSCLEEVMISDWEWWANTDAALYNNIAAVISWLESLPVNQH